MRKCVVWPAVMHRFLGGKVAEEGYVGKGLVAGDVVSGGDAGVLAKGMDKMGVVQKSHPGADVRDGLFLTQQGAGHANPAAVDVLHNGEAGFPFELSA